MFYLLRMYLLAFSIIIGGVGTTHAESSELIKRLELQAAGGDSIAQFKLGVLYDEGRTVPQDDKEALKWYRKAANQGHAEAQFNLGVLYGGASSGSLVVSSMLVCGSGGGRRGIPMDKVRAHMWFNLAASHADEDLRTLAVIARDNCAGNMTTDQISTAQKRAREWKPVEGR